MSASIEDRTLIADLAEDLTWLENHCRGQGGAMEQCGRLRMASALLRNCIGPYLERQAVRPLHVAVVGGAGTGKSTVVNFLAGRAVAEANPQAGYTRHPIAYTLNGDAAAWSGHVGFLGALQRLHEAASSNVDSDVYQIRHLDGDGNHDLLRDCVLWDCPDMTTWAATGYVPRLLEVAALADIIVYVASDERYNDEVPTQFLHLFLQSGKPVIICLTKMSEANAPAILQHFEQEVLGKLAGDAIACLAIPHLTPQQLADPKNQAKRFRIPLINQVAVLGQDPVVTRRHAVRSAANYLIASQEMLVEVARKDVAALQSWRVMVESGQSEFEERYRREFLIGERFHRFDEALVRLLDMLELPGVGRFLSGTLYVLRSPYRWLKSAISRTMSRPETPAGPEMPVLGRALDGWLEMLHKESAHRADAHPVWALAEQGFQGPLPEQARERFDQAYRGFQLSLADEVDRTARAIHEDLERNPTVLNGLRGSKLALDIAAVSGALVAGGIGLSDLVLVPLAASMSHMLVEFFGAQYVESQRDQARQRQEELLRQHLSAPLGSWLTQWPASGGSRFERLQLALGRFADSIRRLDELVTRRLEETVPAGA